MNTTIQKWGNSLAVRIPRSMARQMQVSEGEAVEWRLNPDGLLLRLARRRFELSRLVGEITPANRHQESDWGSPVGREAW